VRIYAPKPYLVVNQTGVTAIYLPDCSQAYALTFGTVLAKNDLSIEIKDGMLTKMDNKQDSTVLGTNFLSAVTEATKVGKSLGTAFSGKVEGGTPSVSLFEASCDAGRLTLRPIPELTQLEIAAPQHVTAPTDNAYIDAEEGTVPPSATTRPAPPK